MGCWGSVVSASLGAMGVTDIGGLRRPAAGRVASDCNDGEE
jgi:hypothetical protein